MVQTYRPEIDGLRAVAVVSVILFHLQLGIPGGFVGVDIFFVISGYLICGIIKRELEQGSFTLVGFWERRIRRILPPAVVTSLLTLGAGYFLLTSSDFQDLGKSVVANALFSSNFYFWQAIDYFTDTATGLPLLHTWSLAVEEQFYLIVPLVLLLISTRSSQNKPRLFLLVLWTSLGLSLAASSVGAFIKPQATFYLLPTRAWELLLGAGLAYLPQKMISTKPLLREIAAWTGIVMIAFCLGAYTEKLPFPGLTALLPCLGAALVIWGNEPREAASLTSVGRLLSLKPVVFVGLISYSLYLFHWPLLVFAKYFTGGPLSPLTTAALLVVLFCAAVLSLKFLEQPVRRKVVLAKQPAVFLFALVSVVVVAGAGALAWKVVPSKNAAFEERINRFVADKVTGETNVTAETIDRDQVRLYGTSSHASADFIVLGDSHAKMSAVAFEDFATTRGLRFATIAYSGTAPLVGYKNVRSKLRSDGSVQWMDSAIRYIARNHVPTVVLAGKWDSPIGELGEQEFQTLLELTVKEITSAGARVYLMLDIPNYGASVPRQMLQDLIGSTDPTRWKKTPRQYEEHNKALLSELDKLKPYGVRILDPRPWLLDGKQEYFLVDEDGSSLYHDDNHLTNPASRKYLGKMIADQFLKD